MIHRGRDDVFAGVAVRGQSAGEINPVHQTPTEQGAEGIGVIVGGRFRSSPIASRERGGGLECGLGS